MPWAYFPSVRERECRASRLVSYPSLRPEWNVRDTYTRATSGRNASKPYSLTNPFSSQEPRSRRSVSIWNFRASPIYQAYLQKTMSRLVTSDYIPLTAETIADKVTLLLRIATLLSRVIVSRTVLSLFFLTRLRNSFISVKSIGHRRNKVAAAVFIRTVVTAPRLHLARVHNIAHRMHLARMPQPVGEIWVIDDGVVENTSHLASITGIQSQTGEVIVDRGCASAIYLAASISIVIPLSLPRILIDTFANLY